MGFHTVPSSWKMIEAEMYGASPRPKIVRLRRSVAEKTATFSMKLLSSLVLPAKSDLSTGNRTWYPMR